MKFVLVIAVVLVAVWVWRNNRRSDSPAPPAQRPLQRPATMIACDRCGMHLPQDEGVRGRSGVYCCQEHRRQAEEDAA